MNSNEMLGAVQRAVLSTDFTNPGGQLSPKQLDAFYLYLRDQKNPFLSQARQIRMPQKMMDIDKLHLGRPITRAASENTAVTFPSAPQAGRTVRLTAEKLQASWKTSRDLIPMNIEMAQLQATIMDLMMRQHGIDLETLAVQGDTDNNGSDELSLLIDANDGWAKLTEESHIVDAAGSGPHYDLFRDAYLAMPSHLVQDPGLKWIWNPAARIRIASDLQNRQDQTGGNALLGNIAGPFGIGFMEAGAIPRNLTISSLAAASAPVARAAVPGPYYITATTKNIRFNIDGGGLTNVDCSTALKHSVTKGALLAVDLAKVINAALQTAYGTTFQYAKDDGDGFLVITSPTAGAGGTVVVTDGAADGALAALTLTAATTTGGAAASGVSKSGSFIWLANPQNFLYGVWDNVRVSSFYDQKYDVDEVVLYTYADFQVEEIDSVVKIKNVIV